ncbi:MAG: L-seryl-tRNA(Sec) selenium transferase, partial [Acidobacteriota bacterium]
LARGPQRLEIELDSGERGGRDRGCAELLTRLTGAEAATVVNNNAAATLLILAALARGRRVAVSRGELVEIGGSYRIPDVMEESGAVLTEVGTTNRTHPRDYRRAIERFGTESGETSRGIGLLLKVHTSNYRVVGFTSGVELQELVALGREHGVPVVHDLGSGCLVDVELGTGEAEGGSTLTSLGETLVRDSVAAGADLVCFSGDKLLGGPQAGILVGRADAIERCRRHPLFRALRPGRMIYTALEATLRIYEAGADEARERIPALARLRQDPAALRRRAREWAERWQDLPGVQVSAVACHSQAGSGSLPARDLPSWGIEVKPATGTAGDLARELRTGDPAILPRVREDAVLFDLRTLDEEEVEEIGRALGESAIGS